jgi:hypothetical protein
MKYVFIGIMTLLLACNQKNITVEKKKSHPSHKYTFVNIDDKSLNYNETNYLPVYSDIYHRDGTNRFMLATTISIRNTSITDSAYVLKATYHDSYGTKLSEYIDSTLLLLPLESIEFVVHEDEQLGGAGANFIIKWGATKYSDQLLIQSIMIGTYGQQGISFVTDAKVVETKTKE